MMILYHFTCGRYLRAIARHGLTVGDVPVDIDRNTGIVAVWLTESPASDGHGLEGSAINKKQYRLGVEVSDADPRLAKWTEWASKNATAQAPRMVTTMIAGGSISASFHRRRSGHASKLQLGLKLAIGGMLHRLPSIFLACPIGTGMHGTESC
jgi:hypothetical protein